MQLDQILKLKRSTGEPAVGQRHDHIHGAGPNGSDHLGVPRPLLLRPSGRAQVVVDVHPDHLPAMGGCQLPAVSLLGGYALLLALPVLADPAVDDASQRHGLTHGTTSAPVGPGRWIGAAHETLEPPGRLLVTGDKDKPALARRHHRDVPADHPRTRRGTGPPVACPDRRAPAPERSHGQPDRQPDGARRAASPSRATATCG